MGGEPNFRFLSKIYLRDRVRERERDLPSTDSTTQMTAIVAAGPGQSQEPGPSSESHVGTGAQGFGHLSLLS